MNRVGPKTLPCGMPLITDEDFDSAPFTLTTWVRSLRKELTYLSILPVIPYASNLHINLRWGTQSKALEKSK